MADRRDRSAYGTLTRDRIIDAAATVVDAEGIEALTMRRLATELGVGTMSLYRHVTDREQLLDLVAERLAGSVEIPSAAPGHGWRDRVHHLLGSLRAVAHAHPRAFPLLAFRPLTTPTSQRQVDAALDVLADAGFDRESGAVLARTLISYVNGFVLAELRGTTPFEGEPAEPDQQFTRGIDLVLDGADRQRRRRGRSGGSDVDRGRRAAASVPRRA